MRSVPERTARGIDGRIPGEISEQTKLRISLVNNLGSIAAANFGVVPGIFTEGIPEEWCKAA